MTTEATPDLKSTLNLTKTEFSQKASLGQREPERLAKWDAMDLYHEIRRARTGRPLFVLHDGPPYANADIHIGTAMNKILKDFVVKSRSMMGYDTPYVPGYDCHGLPIELFVEKELKKTNAESGSARDPVSFRKACREYAADALLRQTRDFQRLGILGEWDNPYSTMSNFYEAEIARIFGEFVQGGYVYKGARPVHWCVSDQTALADHEVEYKEHTSPSIYVKFQFPRDEVSQLASRIAAASPIRSAAEIVSDLGARPVFILIWTTTPWTLPANLGITFHPDFSYSAVRFGSEIYIVASELVESVAEKCGLGAGKVIVSFPGRLLDGLQARHPWLDRPSLLMIGTHVTLGGEADAETELDASQEERHGTGKAGTGCVHTAPGHGHDDFVIGQVYREQLQPIYELLKQQGAVPELGDAATVYCPVDSAGRFEPHVEHFAGMNVFAANRAVVDFLRRNGALAFAEDYEHRYPHCWRCDNPVIFRATSQWFISMDQPGAGGHSLRQGALRETDRVTWIPSWGRTRMRNMLERRPDWCVSRQRFWGVPIPAFYCNGCRLPVIDKAIVDRVAGIFEKESADAWFRLDAKSLLPPGFACANCGGSEFSKDMDILDVWFDSGSSSIAALEKGYGLPWPADVYLEGGDQYRGWFNSSLIVGLVTHDRAPYKTVITSGWTVGEDGKKLSKRQGNAVHPNTVVGSLGADILRLWVASSDPTEDTKVSPEILKRQTDAYRKLRNTARFVLGNTYDFDPDAGALPESELPEIDRWALAVTRDVTAKAVAAYERFDYTSVFHALYNYATVTLSAIYFDILKDRLYTFAPKSKGRRAAQTSLVKIGEAFATLLAPLLAFTSDEVWEHLPGRREKSIHLAEFPKDRPAPGDKELIERWQRLLEVRSIAQKALEEQRTTRVIGGSLEARVIMEAGPDAYDFLTGYQDDLPSILIVSEVELRKSDCPGVRVQVEHARGRKCERCWNWSPTVGEDSRYPNVDARCVRQIDEGWGPGKA